MSFMAAFMAYIGPALILRSLSLSLCIFYPPGVGLLPCHIIGTLRLYGHGFVSIWIESACAKPGLIFLCLRCPSWRALVKGITSEGSGLDSWIGLGGSPPNWLKHLSCRSWASHLTSWGWFSWHVVSLVALQDRVPIVINLWGLGNFCGCCMLSIRRSGIYPYGTTRTPCRSLPFPANWCSSLQYRLISPRLGLSAWQHQLSMERKIWNDHAPSDSCTQQLGRSCLGLSRWQVRQDIDWWVILGLVR